MNVKKRVVAGVSGLSEKELFKIEVKCVNLR